jgi:hypothetical protein
MSECITGRERGLKCFPALPGRPYCYQHDPDLVDARRESARKGAMASHALSRTTPAARALAAIEWESAGHVQCAMEEVAKLVMLGEMTPQQAAPILKAANLWLKVWAQ